MAAEATILEEMLKEMRRMRQAFERMTAGIATAQSEWVDPDEACRIIGVPLTSSNSHRRRLSKLIEKGRLTKFTDGKPRMYNRAELKKVSEMVAQGKIAV